MNEEMWTKEEIDSVAAFRRQYEHDQNQQDSDGRRSLSASQWDGRMTLAEQRLNNM